ncbi:MAG: DUF4097 family beta strand repeat-containing protein [Gemmatimonadota bacterium]
MRNIRLAVLAAVGTALVGLSAQPAAAQDRHGQRDWCDNDWDNDRARLCEERVTTIDADGSMVRVDGGMNGGISIEGWDRDEIQITARVQAMARDDDRAEEILNEIRVVTDGGTIRAEGPRSRFRGRRENWAVSFQLMVPNRSDVDLEANNGGISVVDVEGDLRMETRNGGVSLLRVAGDVRARTTNGGLHIELDGDGWSGAGLDAVTTNGGVDMEIPADYNAELETRTVNGGLEIDFPITVQGRIGGRNSTLNTTLGDGGPTVKAVTTNGGVRIRRS